MKPLFAFLKKEFLETVRTGKLMILLLLFVLFGIMNPAIARLTPWMMEILADTMAESGLIVADVSVDAMTSWMQFFKNIPMALIAFVLLYSDLFTKEYKSGTLLLALTKGLSRCKAVLAKTVLLLSLWTFGYWICFAVTYGYNAYFWDNDIACHLLFAVFAWWLFGVWVISFIVLFSALLQNNAGILLCAGGTVLLTYFISVLPKVREYTPVLLMDSASLLNGVQGTDAYGRAVIITVIMGAACIFASIPVTNRKQL